MTSRLSARTRTRSRSCARSMLLAACLLLGACSKKSETSSTGDPSPPPATSKGVSTASTASTASSADGKALVASACLSCHTEHMLAQQRLTQAQWQKTVTKMVSWGANLEPAEVAPLVAYLSASYGPDAGGYVPETLPAPEALTELGPLADPFPAGDAERGRPLYVDKCSGCHGPDARGHIGVALVDRPLLYRAADVAKIVRKGRGKMTPIALSDGEIADVLAHLRTLKNPLP